MTDLLETQIIKILNGGKCGFIVALPYSGRTEAIRQLFYNPKNAIGEWKDKLQERVWIIVNLPAEKDLMESIKESPYTKGVVGSDAESFIGQLIREKKRKITFIVNSLDTISNNKRIADWNRLLSLYYKFPESISFIVGQGWEEVSNAKELLRDFYGYYFSNRVYLPLWDSKNVDDFLNKKDIDKNKREMFKDFSGGYIYFINRFLENAGLLGNIEKALKDEVVNFGLETLWDSCSEISQQQLIDLITGKKTDFSEYLIGTGMVRMENGRVRLFSSLMELWLKELVGKRKGLIEEKEGKLWRGGREITNELSFQEYAVLKLLWDRANEVINRDEVAEVMWPKNKEESYSNWAIDQLMCKIRRKIGDIGKEKMIKTVRGQGFVLQK